MQEYVGHWESMEAFAEHVLDDMGAPTFIENSPPHLRPYIVMDIAKLARELEAELTTLAEATGVHIFNSDA